MAGLAHMVYRVHVGCDDSGVRHSLGCPHQILLAHDYGTFVPGHPGITCIYNDHFRAVLSQRLVDFVTPDGVSDEVHGLLAGSLENHAHRFTEKLSKLSIGVHLVGAMLAAGFAQGDTAEFGSVFENTDILEALITDDLGV